MQLDMKIWEKVRKEGRQDIRYYPSDVPIFDYEPLTTLYQVVKSPESINEGIISLISLEVDDIAFKWTGFVMFQQSLHSLQHKPGMFIHDPFFSGKILHDCSPNLLLNLETLTAHVIKPIRVFDRLTCDYEVSEDVLYNQFQCSCGSSNCKGWISGRIKDKLE